MRSASDDRGDLTGRAAIRNAALRLFAARGPVAVTVREIANAAGVSPGLVLHHFGSKAGLREAVDEHAASAFDAVLEELGGPDGPDLDEALAGGAPGLMAEAFAHGFPPDSPLPDYLRWLLLSEDPAGEALFARWYAATAELLDSLLARGVSTPSEDPPVRAAFLLVNDLALILLRGPIERALGVDPLSREGIVRWAGEVTTVYTRGAFEVPEGSAP